MQTNSALIPVSSNTSLRAASAMFSPATTATTQRVTVVHLQQHSGSQLFTCSNTAVHTSSNTAVDLQQPQQQSCLRAVSWGKRYKTLLFTDNKRHVKQGGSLGHKTTYNSVGNILFKLQTRSFIPCPIISKSPRVATWFFQLLSHWCNRTTMLLKGVRGHCITFIAQARNARMTHPV